VTNQRWRSSVTIEVPFYDTDAMGIVWHGNYLKYFEVARCALLDSIDYGYAAMRESGYAWPVISVRVRYPGAAVFAQKIIVRASIKEYLHRLGISYLITDAGTGKRLTRGVTHQIAVNIASRETCFASPQILLQKLGVAAP
jgi:acyl-CoA thioester hydrolase